MAASGLVEGLYLTGSLALGDQGERCGEDGRARLQVAQHGGHLVPIDGESRPPAYHPATRGASHAISPTIDRLRQRYQT